MAFVAVAGAAQASAASGWPSQYEGVMLQGFYWDSFTDTKWTNLESQADELSQNFDLIWVPNSGRCGPGNNMGYMPQYWFSNHNSSFGTQSELTSMMNLYPCLPGRERKVHPPLNLHKCGGIINFAVE